MTPLTWQKSTHSDEASACVYMAASPTQTHTLHLRESDAPDVILTTTRPAIHSLLAHLRAGHATLAPSGD